MDSFLICAAVGLFVVGFLAAMFLRWSLFKAKRLDVYFFSPYDEKLDEYHKTPDNVIQLAGVVIGFASIMTAIRLHADHGQSVSPFISVIPSFALGMMCFRHILNLYRERGK